MKDSNQLSFKLPRNDWQRRLHYVTARRLKKQNGLWKINFASRLACLNYKQY